MNGAKTLALGVITSTLFLVACGDVGFVASDGQTYKSCTATGADLANCFSPPPGLTPKTQSINVRASTAVDILFVVDNSGSMSQEQVGIANKINGFLDKIKNLNWQIALTTTSPVESTLASDNVARNWGDGQFRPFDSDGGSEYILRSTQVNAADAQAKLASAIQVGILGSGDERGINAAYRAVERSISPGTQRDFFRPGASLAVIVISDENECSNGLANCAAGTSHRSDPTSVRNFFKSTLGADKIFSFNSIIGIPGDSSCSTAANAGTVYRQISLDTGGVVASVCSSDFTTPLNVLGQKVVDLIRSVSLSCVPKDISGDNQPDVTVRLASGTLMTSGFTVSGTTVTFASALPEGNHTFGYFCE